MESKSLPPKEATKLEKMVDNAKKTKPKKLTGDIRGADYFEYKISIEETEGKYVIETNDIIMEPAVKPLIDFLSRKL